MAKGPTGDSSADRAAEGSVRVTCTVPALLHQHLERMVATGYFGAHVAGVMTHLAEQGVRDAVERGLLRLP